MLSVAAPPRIPVVAGMACSVELKVYDKEKAITVPASAVFDDDGEADHEYVFVVTDKGHSKRPVKTGRSKGDNTEIVDGLKDGEEILLSRPESE